MRACVSACVNVSVCMRACEYICVCCVCICVYIYLCVCMCECVRAPAHACVFLCECVLVCVCMCTCVCVSVCISDYTDDLGIQVIAGSIAAVIEVVLTTALLYWQRNRICKGRVRRPRVATVFQV